MEAGGERDGPGTPDFGGQRRGGWFVGVWGCWFLGLLIGTVRGRPFFWAEFVKMLVLNPGLRESVAELKKG